MTAKLWRLLPHSLAHRIVLWSSPARVPVRSGAMVRNPKNIGGSDAPAICGKDQNKTAYAVALRITGQIQSDELAGLDHIEFGNEIEGVLARFYERKEKVRLYIPESVTHQQYPFLSVNIDRLREDAMHIGIECKNTGLYTQSDDPQQRWGEPGTDEVPARVALQCQHGMMVCPFITEFHVLRCYGGNAYQKFVVPRHDALCRNLLEIELEFMDNIRKGMLPQPDWGHRTTKETIKKAFQKIQGNLEHKPELIMWTDAWQQAAAERLRLEKLEESLKNQIEHMMGNTEVGMLPDGRSWVRKKVNRKGYAVEPTSYIECRLTK